MVLSLSRIQVNSWRLTNHHLVKKERKGQIEKVVSSLCGVQAQVLSYAALAIWARVDDITIQDVENALWKHRSLVKTWCMRGTLHLLASTDLPVYVAARKTTQTIKTDWLSPEVDVDHRKNITSTIRKVLDHRILTREELAEEVARLLGMNSSERTHLLSGWGNLLHPAAEQGYLCFGPSQGTKVAFVRPDQWIGKWDEPNGTDAWKTLLRRFVKAYGPANHLDLGHWWGLRPDKARTLFENIEEELEEVGFEGQRRWVLREDLDRIADIERVESVNLLPSWDVYVMFYHPRELFISKTNRERVFTKLQGNRPVLLIDGAAGGVWEQKQRGKITQIRVEPFGRLRPDQKLRIREEANSLGESLETTIELKILE